MSQGTGSLPEFRICTTTATLSPIWAVSRLHLCSAVIRSTHSGQIPAHQHDPQQDIHGVDQESHLKGNADGQEGNRTEQPSHVKIRPSGATTLNCHTQLVLLGRETLC